MAKDNKVPQKKPRFSAWWIYGLIALLLHRWKRRPGWAGGIERPGSIGADAQGIASADNGNFTSCQLIGNGILR